MATKIPIEILIKILNNVQSTQSTQDLYSSLLVNRIWCKVTIPILWKLPLDQEFFSMNYKLKRKKALCIRTYISCMDTQSRALLIQNGFDLLSSPSQSTFDYPSFIREFRIENLSYITSVYSQKIIDSDQDNNYYNNNSKPIITTKSRILFHEICKLIINRSTFLDSFKMTNVPDIFLKNFLNSDLICSIIKLPGAPKVFKKLETFVSMTKNDELIGPLYESLSLICDNILNLVLEFKSESQVKLLEKLINVQKRLESLSITDDGHIKCNSLLWVIISQKTLRSLRLKSVKFYNFEGKSSPTVQFTSLKELYIEDCDGLYNPECLIFASSFTQLSSLYLSYQFLKYPQEFIIKILETSNTNLKNISLNLYHTIPADIISVILNYCTKITKLTLLNLSPDQVIAIFNDNFNELRRFTFDCGKGLDSDELLCQMAENVPESLEIIEIRIGIFRADSLRKFFEGWRRNGRGGNKKMIMKQIRRFILSNEHLEVFKEYGVQYEIK